ncbi:demethylmenaquinone methyltransferase [Bacillus sp. FJAT-44742]|uniref:demethylmenaquinone methyltransferase n=1 Tax=Bacillus sp. FJAT-44742 TaxID=2014005 RepID=UPI000C235DE6|nr:demethylmenaquinone methyltransferase [Bacillus sp. FJAT-44742]
MAKTKEERVHQVFESIHDKYDMMNSVISFQRHKAWRKDTMKKMKVFEGAKALDICCGTGDWTLALAKEAGESGEVTGLDFSANMLQVGQKKVDASKYGNITLMQGNAMNLPFEDDSFDFVTIGFGLRNVPDYDTVLQEMHRVLKPGGQAVCLETSQPEKSGFKQVYNLYFKYVMPAFGKVLAKSYDEYSWLQESTMNFPDKNKLTGMFFRAGFDRVDVQSYSGGVAATHFAVKKGSAVLEDELG